MPNSFVANCGVCVCVCERVSERESARERERERMCLVSMGCVGKTVCGARQRGRSPPPARACVKVEKEEERVRWWRMMSGEGGGGGGEGKSLCFFLSHSHCPPSPHPSLTLSPFPPPLSHTRYSDTCLAGGFVLDAAEGRYLRALLGWPAESREKMIFSICLVQVQMWSSLV